MYWAERENAKDAMRFRQFLEVQPGEKVLLVDDILRTGTKLSELKTLVESQGGEVVGLAVVKFDNGFMDVAEEEGKRTVASTKDGHVSEGHDAAFTVEIPSWGIREKFGSGAEARAYLGGEYKTYDNAQRLANERGLALTYGTDGHVLNGPTGTFTAKTMEDVGKVLARTPDPRWAPGGQFDAGTTLKDSRDAMTPLTLSHGRRPRRP